MVEVFGARGGDADRDHVALMKEPKIMEPNRKGRRLVPVSHSTIGVDEDEYRLLAPLLEKISDAIRSARDPQLP